ncbi:MAG TPA: HAMP domain-containing sensor histidine kinase [Anaerolineales bacterium]|nr:HAMP domain-containing sensor histidine kinase [Anaerolineales bacterium]
MDSELLDLVVKMDECVGKEDWRKGLDSLFSTLRKKFVFDNLAIYSLAAAGGVPEAVYARAIGRGRSKEAEASWGEEIANQVASTGKVVVFSPSGKASVDRIDMPYLLGLPLNLSDGNGALVFVRFGGPEYATDQIPLAALAVAQAARTIEHRSLRENLAQLELARYRAQFQDDFIATISHELHTPIGFIKGYTTSLLRSDTIWDPATQREFLTIIDEESDHLVSLVDRILDSARLQSGNMPMEYQPVRLDSLLRDVVMRTRNRVKAIDVDLELESATPIEADTVRLTQVFDNLFENAMKYAPGTKITISLKVLPDKQVVTFSDRGPGIPSEHLPFLFERFYRVPGHSGKRGAGLGLFICKQIILAHRGQISVKTAPGKGTAFVIELPAHSS